MKDKIDEIGLANFAIEWQKKNQLVPRKEVRGRLWADAAKWAGGSLTQGQLEFMYQVYERQLMNDDEDDGSKKLFDALGDLDDGYPAQYIITFLDGSRLVVLAQDGFAREVLQERIMKILRESQEDEADEHGD